MFKHVIFILLIGLISLEQLCGDIMIVNRHQTTTVTTTLSSACNCCFKKSGDEAIYTLAPGNSLEITSNCLEKYLIITLQIPTRSPESLVLKNGDTYTFSGDNNQYKFYSSTGAIYITPPAYCTCWVPCIDLCYTMLRCCNQCPCEEPHDYATIDGEKEELPDDLKGKSEIVLWPSGYQNQKMHR